MADRQITVKLKLAPDDQSVKKVREIGNLLASPALLRQRVANEKAVADAQRRFGKAMADERQRQWKPETLFGHLSKAIGGKAPTGEAPGGAIGEALTGVLGEGAAGELGSLAGALAPVAGLIAGAGAALVALGETAKATVSKFAPGALVLFQRTADDVMATIGRSLLPVMRLWTDELRILGDFLATVLPTTDEVNVALAPLDDALGSLREVAEALAPVVKEAVGEGLGMLADYFSALAPVMKDVAVIVRDLSPAIRFLVHVALDPLALAVKAVAVVIKGVAEAVREVTEALFGKAGPTKPLDNSTGMAAGQISFGDMDSAARKVYASAFQSGAGGKPKTELQSMFGDGSEFQTFLHDAVDFFKWAKTVYDKTGRTGAAAAQGAAQTPWWELVAGGPAAMVWNAARAAWNNG